MHQPKTAESPDLPLAGLRGGGDDELKARAGYAISTWKRGAHLCTAGWALDAARQCEAASSRSATGPSHLASAATLDT